MSSVASARPGWDRELPEFVSLMARDRSKWPRCLLWHGWLLGLTTAGERAPLADSFGQLAGRSLEVALDAYPVDDTEFWAPPGFWDAQDLATEIGDHPCLWMELYPSVGFAVAGAGVYLPAPEVAMGYTLLPLEQPNQPRTHSEKTSQSLQSHFIQIRRLLHLACQITALDLFFWSVTGEILCTHRVRTIPI